MADAVYLGVKRRIEELEDELEKLRKFVAMYDDMAAIIGGNEPYANAIEHLAGDLRHRYAVRVGGRRRGADTAAMLTAVEEILTKEQPLATKDLLERLTARGISVGGSNTAHNLANYLSREKSRFVSQRGVGWSLVGQQKLEETDPAAGL